MIRAAGSSAEATAAAAAAELLTDCTTLIKLEPRLRSAVKLTPSLATGFAATYLHNVNAFSSAAQFVLVSN